jgi:hypothetical protein
VEGPSRELKAELERGPDLANCTIEEFSQIYLEEYCRTRNRRPEFKQQALVSVERVLGKVRLQTSRELTLTASSL